MIGPAMSTDLVQQGAFRPTVRQCWSLAVGGCSSRLPEEVDQWVRAGRTERRTSDVIRARIGPRPKGEVQRCAMTLLKAF